jgi:uncharacterized damage-inducible protein DinB
VSDLVHVVRQHLAWTVWADTQHLRALAHVAPEHLVVETGTSFGSLLGTAAHVVGAETVWIARFRGESPDRVPGLVDWPDFASLESAWGEAHAELQFFLAGLTNEQLSGDFVYSSTSGQARRQPLWQGVFHLVQHSTYHRGQLASLSRQLGYAPPSTDLVHWFLTR